MKINEIKKQEIRNELDNITEIVIGQNLKFKTPYHSKSHLLPSKSIVVEILDDMHNIIFPGYNNSDVLSELNIDFFIRSKLNTVFHNLSGEIFNSYIHHDEFDLTEEEKDMYYFKSVEASLEVLNSIPYLKDALDEDINAAYEGDPATKSKHEIIYSSPGLFAIFVYRISHILYNLEVPLIPRIMSSYAHCLTGIDIHEGAKIGKYFFIDHGTGVVIGETAEVGDCVKIYQGVTLGALSFPKDDKGKIIKGLKRHPKIEDHVTIYSGATILGGETVIGHHCIIGGNVWITSSVPPYYKVLLDKNSIGRSIKTIPMQY